HEIVRQAGGTAEIEPTGDGTRVTVRLPWHATFAVPARPEPAELEPEPAGRVLLVDDDDAVRSSVAAMLRAAGYGVTVAGTAAEALALLDDGFDVVVADVVLPGISGPDLCFRVLA